MKPKHISKILPCAVFIAFLCSCSNSSEIITEDYVMGNWAQECFYEGEAFDCVSNGVKHLITYYSAAADKCVPICTKPNCTHSSDDCTAVVNNAIGMIKAEDGLMFFDYDDKGSLNLIKSDFNGSNRKTIASLDNLISYTLIDIAYCKDKALCLYQDMIGFEEELKGQEIDGKVTDEYVNRVACIDINTGEVTDILYKKDHAASLLNALIYDNKLIYSYQSYTKDIRDLSDGEKPDDYYRSGFYCLDLASGEEKKLSEGYDRMIMPEQSFNYFDPERIICCDLTDNKLYLYNLNTGNFSYISECAGVYNKFMADNNDMFYLVNSDDTQYAKYDYKTGETIYIPNLPEDYFPTCIVGNTVWLHFLDEERRLCRGWISKDDFLNGNHNNIKFAYYVNSLDGSAKY